MFNLVIADDEGKQTTVPVVRDEISIGRKEGNTIRLTERNVSRNHGKLVKVNGTVFFEEVSARYGTLWNGEKVRGRTELKFGDILTVGDYRLFLANQDGSIPDVVKRQLEPEDAAPAPEQRDATEVLTMQPRPTAPTMGEPGKLRILNTEYAGQEYALLGEKMVIGRTADNDIMIDHKSISRNHARVERVEGGVYRVTDMGSANGISINGEPRQTAELRRGDTVEFGNVKLRFIAPGEIWSYAPGMADISGEAVPADSGGGMGKMIAILVVVLLLVGGGVAVMMGGGDGEGEGETAGHDDAGAATETGGTGPIVDNTGTPDQSTANAEAHQLAINRATALMQDKRWDDVVEALSEVPDASPLSAQADQMEVRARAEMRHRDDFNQATEAEAGGNSQEALTAYARIPEDSAYHSDATLARNRIKEAVITEAINACQASIGGHDFDAARTALQPALALFPSEERLTNQMSTIDSAEEEYQREQEAAAERDRERDDRERDDRERDDRERDDRERDDRERDDGEDVAVVTPPVDDDDGESDELSPSERRARASDLMRDARREGIRGNHDAAIELLEEAKDLNPGESRIYLMLYTNYSREGDDREAARALREYLRREPNDPNAANYRDIIEGLEN